MLRVTSARKLAYGLKDTFLPNRRPFLEIDGAIDAFENSLCAKFFKSVIDIFSEPAKMLVICITQGEDRKTEIRQGGALLLLERFPKRNRVVGWIPFSPCTCND